MAVCNKDCFNCVHDDCINDRVVSYEPAAKYRRTHREELMKKSREKRAERKAAGICMRCGARPAVKGKTVCIDCLIQVRNNDTKRRRRNGALPKQMLDGTNLCTLCGKKEPMKGHKVCEDCLPILQENMAHARKFKDYSIDRRRHEAIMRSCFRGVK